MIVARNEEFQGQALNTAMLLGRVVRKPVNANLGLRVNRSINFSCLKCFSHLVFLVV